MKKDELILNNVIEDLDVGTAIKLNETMGVEFVIESGRVTDVRVQ